MSIPSGEWLELSECIHSALEAAAGEVTQDGPSDWSFAVRGATPFTARAFYDREFLVFDVSLPMKKEAIWSFLCANLRAAGTTKFALADRQESVRLLAEIMPREEGYLPARIEAVCHDLEKSLAIYQGLDSRHDNGSIEEDEVGDDFLELCAEAGWKISRRTQGTVMRLEVPGHPREARVSAREGVGIVASVDLATCQAMSGENRTALALLLLTASGCIRMVRACAMPLAKSETVLRFEVVFKDPLSVSIIDHGLSALSTACYRSGKEVRALLKKEILSNYLWTREWSSPSRS